MQSTIEARYLIKIFINIWIRKKYVRSFYIYMELFQKHCIQRYILIFQNIFQLFFAKSFKFTFYVTSHRNYYYYYYCY